MTSWFQGALYVSGLLWCTCHHRITFSWWHHQMEIFSALLAFCEGNSLITDEFPSQRPVTRSFNVFFDLRLNKWLIKQSWGCRFETQSCPLWRHCNEKAGNVRCATRASAAMVLTKQDKRVLIFNETSNDFKYRSHLCVEKKQIRL